MINKTKVMQNESKGHEMFSIFEFDAEGNKNFKPLVNMGARKARLILKHVKELEQFVDRTKEKL